MRVPTPKGLRAVNREEFLKELCRRSKELERSLAATDNKLNIYGGLIKRGYSRSDIDYGLYRFREPTKSKVLEIMKAVKDEVCPECPIDPTENPHIYGEAVIHADFEDVSSHCDNLEAYQKVLDGVVDAFKKVTKESKVYPRVEDDVERIIRDVVDTCSAKPNITDALECHRTQLHSRREALTLKVRDFVDEVQGRVRPLPRWPMASQ